MDILADARFKIARAEHHLEVLKQAIQSFFDAGHYTLRLKPNPSPPKYVLTASRDWVIPVEWSMIVGEFAHNARSSLDMIVYRLSGLPEADRARRHLQFPIVDAHKKYLKSKEACLNRVDSPAQDVVESFQPYRNGGTVQDDPLLLLAEINNADKHRLIHVIEVVSSVDGVGICGPGKYGANMFAGPGAAIKLGPGASVDAGGFFFRSLREVEISNTDAPIAEIESAVPPTMRVHPRMSAQIKFGGSCPEVQGRLVIGTLRSILDRVQEVVRRFEPSV